MFRSCVVLGLVAGFASPAAAVTFVFGGSTANVPSITTTVGGIGLTVTPRRFTLPPSTLTLLSQTSPVGQVSITPPGIGVAGGASTQQIDTNVVTAREALLFSFSQPVALIGMRLSFVDENDTLQVYGVGPSGALASLGFAGLIRTGLAGAATFSHDGTLNGGTTILSLNSPTGLFGGLLFTTRVGGDELFNGTRGQGYRMDSISVRTASVPQPGTWMLLIVGAGLAGLSMRSRNTVRTA